MFGPALLAEYEDVLGRTELFTDSVLSAKERFEVFDGFLNRCRWVEVFYAWRPNLPDEAGPGDIVAVAGLLSVTFAKQKGPSLAAKSFLRVVGPE